jgi:NifU-like protein involved in Fe-S cluster formation
VRFRAEACAICTAAASILTERIRGLEIGAAARIDDDQLIDSLETTLPTERRRCATLPLEALRAAVPAALSDLHSRDTETR